MELGESCIHAFLLNRIKIVNSGAIVKWENEELNQTCNCAIWKNRLEVGLINF
jgi:hypothetical protein